MRTELLCALALLCGAELAYGQYYYPANTNYYNNNYYRGYSPGYTYPYNNYGYYQNQAQPRTYYYPINSTADTYQTTTPRYTPVASGNQIPDSTVPVLPSETGPTVQVAPEIIDPLPPAEGARTRSKLIQPSPDGDGPPRLAVGDFMSSVGDFMSSLWPAPVPFHRPLNDGFWFSTEYMQGWMRPGPLAAPLVSSGSGGPGSHPAAIGDPNTTILYGGPINYPTTPGVRMEIGCFVDSDSRVSVELSGLYYSPTYNRFSAKSDGNGNPAIGKPAFDTNPLFNREFAELVSLPGQIAGGTTINSTSQLWGFESNARYHIYAFGRLNMDFLAGFRFLRLTEDLVAQDNATALAPGALTFLGAGNPLAAGSSIADRDSFSSVNQFAGLNLGTRLEWEGDNYFISAFGKMAVGCTNESVVVAGNSSAFTPGGTINAPGGVFSLPSNIGNYSRNVLTIVPECGLNFGVDVTPHIRLTAGYSFLYWNQVARPGAQIDHSVNSAQIPVDPNYNPSGGAGHPAFSFAESPFWVHTLTCGVEFHF